MAQRGVLLPLLLSNSLNPSTGAAAPLVVLSDSLLQPGLLLLRQIIAETLSRNEHVILISLEQTPTRLVPASHRSSASVDHIDAVSTPPFASTSSASLDAGLVDLHAEGGVQQLEKAVLEAVKRRKGEGKRITVVLDSVDALAEKGVHAVVSLVKRAVQTLRGGTPGSRLVTLHHTHFPSAPAASSPALQPDLLATLLSPTLSPCTIHLTLHPSPLLETLSRDYGLSIPPNPTLFNPIDLRLTSFLESFASRNWGDPFKRPKSSLEEDQRVPLDLGGREAAEGGACVVEWSARGVANVPNLPAGAGGRKLEQAKRILSRGLEGLRRTKEGVEPAGLADVLDKKRMSAVSLPATSTATATSTSSAARPPDPSSLLPFNLSLTSSQEAAREGVPLPFVPTGGVVVPGGGIDYSPDGGDDMDDDDPDEDLEV